MVNGPWKVRLPVRLATKRAGSESRDILLTQGSPVLRLQSQKILDFWTIETTITKLLEYGCCSLNLSE
jgi:hypothetical protein